MLRNMVDQKKSYGSKTLIFTMNKIFYFFSKNIYVGKVYASYKQFGGNTAVYLLFTKVYEMIALN